jgi:uncharacterized protein YcgI (DUF1989 family)
MLVACDIRSSLADEMIVNRLQDLNVALDGSTGKIKVLPPRSQAGDHIVFLAEADLIIALTACSAPQSNNGAFKPIDFEIAELPQPGLA